MIGYLTLIVGMLAVFASVWASLWLARRRKIVAPASDAGEGLRRAAQRFGLDEVRESSLYQARILTAWGEVNDFQIHCELWEQVQDPFYRVTIGFPQPLRRGIRISRDVHGGLMQQVMNEESASEDILVESNQDIGELRTFLQDDLRRPLEHLAARVNRMQMGDEYLYLFVKNAPDGAFCESVLHESVAVASKVFGRAMLLGPSKKSAVASSYGQAKSEMTRRISDEVEGEPRVEEARPTGRITLANMAAISGDEVFVESDRDGKADAFWAQKPDGGPEQAQGSKASIVEESREQREASGEVKRSPSSTLQGVGIDIEHKSSEDL